MIIKTLGLSSFTRGVKALSVGDSKLIRSRSFSQPAVLATKRGGLENAKPWKAKANTRKAWKHLTLWVFERKLRRLVPIGRMFLFTFMGDLFNFLASFVGKPQSFDYKFDGKEPQIR